MSSPTDWDRTVAACWAIDDQIRMLLRDRLGDPDLDDLETWFAL